ncbi:MAG: GxxExxY protein [Chloroflexi bacterium]|nr:GxxExxY protein [Chloroflexota bacterium]
MKNKLDPSIPHQDITYRIIGCAMRVHNRLGPGLREKMYQRALTAEMRADGMEVIEEYRIDVYDGDVWIGTTYPDHWVENKVVVEVEAFSHFLTKTEIAQTIGFLAAANTPVGLLINFGRKRLDYQRILLPNDLQDWKKYITRFLWRPPGAGPPQRAREEGQLPADDKSG